MLCTLLKPTSGRAILNGFDVCTNKNDVRESIGLVFQDPSLDDRLTALENLQFHAVVYRVPMAERASRIKEVLEMVELTDRADERVETYSGGMKRRLEIARGLLHYPKVLFLDEPTIGLDPQTRNHIWNYIEELKQHEDITIFLTTHYMDEAENCDRIAIIDHGKIIALDTPEQLKGMVGVDVVKIKTADDPAAERELKEIWKVDILQDRDCLCFEVEKGEEFVPRFIRDFDIKVDSISVHRPTLDDVFMKLTGREIREQGSRGQRGLKGLRALLPASRQEQEELVMSAAVSQQNSSSGISRRDEFNKNFRGGLIGVYVIWLRDLKRFWRDTPRRVGAFFQPILYLFLLGTGMQSAFKSFGGGEVKYVLFMFPGILGMTVLFTAVFSAISIVWDRQFGFLKEVLVSPIPRSSVAVGKVVGGATTALMQGMVLMVLAFLPMFFGFSLTTLWKVLELIPVIALLAIGMTSLGVVVAARMRSFEGFPHHHELRHDAPVLPLRGDVPPAGTARMDDRPHSLQSPYLRRRCPARHRLEGLSITSATSSAMPTLQVQRYPLWLDLVVVLGFTVVLVAVAVWQFGKQD